MESSLLEGILSICGVLNRNSVQYLIVGGTAVALHGHYRQSMSATGEPLDKHDIDIWYSPTYDNYFKLLDALEEYGIDVELHKKEKDPNPRKSFFRFDVDYFTLDLLPELRGLGRFTDYYKDKEIVSSNDIDIPFIGLSGLIESKKAIFRPKDEDDIAHLI